MNKKEEILKYILEQKEIYSPDVNLPDILAEIYKLVEEIEEKE